MNRNNFLQDKSLSFSQDCAVMSSKCILHDFSLFCYQYLNRYQKVIEACALQPDIDSLPAGDSSEIGEKVGEVYIYLILCSFIFRVREILMLLWMVIDL